MIKRGEKFPEEKRAHGAESPGIVLDDEELERRLPPGKQETGGRIPQVAFPRRELQWTEDEGGASVDRSRYAHHGIAGPRGPRSTIKAKAGDVRRLTDAEGNRLWSVTDRPLPDNRAHAEIQREPLGTMPSRADRNQFMEVWQGAIALLKMLREEDAQGKPELRLIPDTGVAIYWRSGLDAQLQRVVQVESVAEAVRAYIGAGMLAEADAAEEQDRLEKELSAHMRDTQRPNAGPKSACCAS